MPLAVLKPPIKVNRLAWSLRLFVKQPDADELPFWPGYPSEALQPPKGTRRRGDGWNVVYRAHNFFLRINKCPEWI